MATKPNDAAFESSGEIGLTKREFFSALFLAAMLAGDGSDMPKNPEESAVAWANVLIRQLNKDAQGQS